MRESTLTIIRSVGASRFVHRVGRYLAAAGIGAMGLGALGRGVAVLGSTCTALCQPTFTLTLGALAGIMAVVMVEMDERVD